ncbi:MAG: DUF7507 domain-containing protein [Chloroflexota bacterium]
MLALCLLLFVFPNLGYASGGFVLQADGPLVARPSDLIHYTVYYQNLGWPLLTDVMVYGRVPEYTSFVSAPANCQLEADTLVCQLGTLPYGRGGSLQVTLRVDGDAPADGIITSEVTAVGRQPGGKLMILNQTQGYTEIVVPALTLEKAASASLIYAGDSVIYTYTATNTGDVALTDVALVDDHKSPAQVCDTLPRLDAGATYTCTWTAALDADTTNLATVTGLDPWQEPVTATASAFVDTIQQPDPGGSGVITLEKVASASMVYAGDEVVYTYIVTNLSHDPVLDISLTDDRLGQIAGPFDLAAAQSVSLAVTATLFEDTTNVAVAEGHDLLGGAVRAEASAFVSVVPPDVTLELELIASAMRVYPGDSVRYTCNVRNTGSDVALGIVLTGELFDTPIGPFDLTAGATATYAVEWMLEADTTHTVVASGQDRLGRPVEAQASLTVDTIWRPGPDGEGIISLELIPSEIDVKAGTEVVYTYLVTNLSPDPVSQIVVTDETFGVITPLGEAHALDMYEGFTLEGGESRALIVSVPVYQSAQNVATAMGQDLLLHEVSAQDSTFVYVWTETPTQTFYLYLPLVLGNSH